MTAQQEAAQDELFANLELVSNPPSQHVGSPGAALSLAIHCLLVSKGESSFQCMQTY